MLVSHSMAALLEAIDLAIHLAKLMQIKIVL